MQRNNEESQSDELSSELSSENKLPKSITHHPYFHQTKENEARQWLVKLPLEEGNCLFCFVDENEKKKFDFVCLFKLSDNSIINTIYYRYSKHLQASQGCYKSTRGADWIMGRNSYSASLYEAVEFVSRICKEVKRDYLKPIFNPTAQNQLKRLPLLTNDAIGSLPHEIVRLIFDYLDLKSISNACLVSTKWNSFFSDHLHKMSKLQHDEVKKTVDRLMMDY